jgi:hypothetical protein
LTSSLPLTLGAGKSFTFSVTFTPKATGTAAGNIALTSNASGAAPSIPLSGSGTATGQLAVSPSSFAFGNVVVGQSKAMTVNLGATGANLTVTAASTGSAEFALTGPSLPTTIQSGGNVSFSLTFTPQSSGAANTNVSFTTSASSAPITESSSGTGVAPPEHSADLSWPADSSTVMGYNVYRGGTSGGPYSKLNASTDDATTYTDGTVQAGKTYYYVVTAVGNSGKESSYSNQVSAVIPTP